MNKSNGKLLVTVVLGSLLIGTMTTNVLAQKPKQGYKINHEQVLNSLNLSEDVRTSLAAIMDQQKAKMDTMHQQKQKERYQAHKEKRALHEAHKAQVKALLSDEQFAAFEEAIWVQRHQMHNKNQVMHGQTVRR